jgi:hypothetical protein
MVEINVPNIITIALISVLAVIGVRFVAGAVGVNVPGLS